MPPEAAPSPAKIDPSPRSGDVTSFEQAKAKAPPRRAEAELEGDMDAPDPVRSSMRENVKPPRPFNYKRGESPVKNNNPPEKKVEAKKPAPAPKKEEKKPDLDDEDFGPAKDPDPSGVEKKKKDDAEIERDLEDYADQEKPGIEPDDDEEEEEDDEKSSEEEQKEEPDEEDEEKAIETEIEKIGPLSKVRKAHKEALKKIKRHEAAIATSEQNIAALKKQLKEATEGALAVEQREAFEKKIEQYEERIRATDYKGSEEFREKYRKPLHQAWEACLADLEEMAVEGDDGQMHKATQEDFRRILSMPDLGSASAEARRIFGPEVSPIVMQHRQNIRKASRNLEIADKEAVKNSQEVAKKRAEHMASERTRQEKIYAKEFDEYGEKNANLFGDREEDPEGNALLRKGWERVQAVIAPDPEVPEDTRIKRLVALRYKAAAFGRLWRDTQALQAQVKELQSQLDEYESSKPKPGRDLGDSETKSEDDDGVNIEDYADRNYR